MSLQRKLFQRYWTESSHEDGSNHLTENSKPMRHANNLSPASKASRLLIATLPLLLTVACSVWMHWTVVQMLHEKSPELATHLETPPEQTTAAGTTTREPEEARV